MIRESVVVFLRCRPFAPFLAELALDPQQLSEEPGMPRLVHLGQ
jgi:hypothetical protein